MEQMYESLRQAGQLETTSLLDGVLAAVAIQSTTAFYCLVQETDNLGSLVKRVCAGDIPPEAGAQALTRWVNTPAEMSVLQWLIEFPVAAGCRDIGNAFMARRLIDVAAGGIPVDPLLVSWAHLAIHWILTYRIGEDGDAGNHIDAALEAAWRYVSEVDRTAIVLLGRFGDAATRALGFGVGKQILVLPLRGGGYSYGKATLRACSKTGFVLHIDPVDDMFVRDLFGAATSAKCHFVRVGEDIIPFACISEMKVTRGLARFGLSLTYRDGTGQYCGSFPKQTVNEVVTAYDLWKQRWGHNMEPRGR